MRRPPARIGQVTLAACAIGRPPHPARPGQYGWRGGLRRPSGCGDRARGAADGARRRDDGVLRNGALNASWAPYIPHIKSDLELSARGLGFVLLAMAFGAVASMPAAGFMVERFGARSTLAGAVALGYVALPFVLLAPTPLALAGVLVALGASTGVTDVAMNANGAAVEHRYGRPILSSLHAFWSIGAFAARASPRS